MPLSLCSFSRDTFIWQKGVLRLSRGPRELRTLGRQASPAHSTCRRERTKRTALIYLPRGDGNVVWARSSSTSRTGPDETSRLPSPLRRARRARRGTWPPISPSIRAPGRAAPLKFPSQERKTPAEKRKQGEDGRRGEPRERERERERRREPRRWGPAARACSSSSLLLSRSSVASAVDGVSARPRLLRRALGDPRREGEGGLFEGRKVSRRLPGVRHRAVFGPAGTAKNGLFLH